MIFIIRFSILNFSYWSIIWAYLSATNKIQNKSIDFVIVEPNLKIKLCIELDDYTHKREQRIKRDEFLNKLFNDLEIKLLRIPVQNYYNLEELKKKIEESL